LAATPGVTSLGGDGGAPVRGFTLPGSGAETVLFELVPGQVVLCDGLPAEAVVNGLAPRLKELSGITPSADLELELLIKPILKVYGGKLVDAFRGLQEAATRKPDLAPVSWKRYLDYLVGTHA